MLTSNKYSGVFWLQRHRIKLVVALVLITAYALAGFLWIPRLIRNQGITFVETQLHRHLSLGEISFNPFTLTLRIHDIKLDEASEVPIARINDLLINAELSSLWHRAYVFKQVRIDTPAINMIINDKGELNLAALQPPSASATSPPTALPRIRIDSFELLKGQLNFVDHSRPKPFDAELKPITFTLQNFRTEPDYENAFHFAALSEEKESLDWRGDFTVQPFAASGQLKIGSLKAATIQSYLQDKLPLVLSSGLVDVEGRYKLTTAKQFDVALSLSNIHLTDIHVQPKDTGSQQDWVVLPQASVTDMTVSLHDRDIDIKSLAIDDAVVQAWLDERRQLNLLQLSGNNDDKSSTGWNTHIAAINLNHSIIHAEDRAVQPAATFVLNPVQVQLQNISTAPGTQMSVDAQMNINGSAQLKVQGNIQLDTLHTSLQLHLNKFALPALQSYAAQSTDVIIHGGDLNTDGSLVYKGSAASKEPMLQYSGAVEVNNLDTEDKATGGDFIKCQRLQLANFRYAMSPDQLSIDKVIAHGLYGRVAINADSTTNVQQALRIPVKKVNDSTASNQPPVKPAAPAMKVQVTRVVIEDSTADFSDESVTPNFAAGIENLNGEITGLSTSNSSRATVKLQGNVDNYAPVSVTGEVNFLAASAYSDLSLDFRNIELTTFNPYSGKFAGYDIAKGKLATQLHYSIVDRKLNAQHHIVLDQLEFGKATDSKDALSLPIKLAVALLKDRTGVIELDLPVGGSLDDPDFRVGPIVWKAFKNLLTKIVTSPFAALGSLFGGSENLAFVDFVPGSAVLANTERDKLNTLAHALVERPQLKLDVPLNAVTDADVKAVSQTALDKALGKYLPNAASATPQQHLDALTTLFRDKTGNLPEFSDIKDKSTDVVPLKIAALQKQLLQKFAPSDDQRYDLAAQRADAIQSALLTNTQLSAERIYKINTDFKDKSPTGVVRVEMKLE